MTKSAISGACLVFLLFMAVAAELPAFPADGVFQGTVVQPPKEERLPAGWILVREKHILRRVEVAHAVVVLVQPGASRQGGRCGSGCLAVGQEVRVTASQDSSGEWRAKRVEILRLADPQCCGQAVSGEFGIRSTGWRD